MATKKKNEAEEQRDENTAPEQNPENARSGGESLAPAAHSAPQKETEERRTPENKEDAHGGQAPQSRETPKAASDPGEDGKDAAPRRNLEELALRRRVPTWQQAALARFMGWEDGKMLTEAEYDAALNQLAARRLGGGQNQIGGRNM